MPFVLINHAEDGTHESVHRNEVSAKRALARMLGREPAEFAPGRTYISDFGNRLIVETRPSGHNARDERALRRAFDARECGHATKRQLALLARVGF